MTRPSSFAAVAVAGMLVLADVSPALAYLKLGVTIGSRTLSLQWNRQSVPYFVSNRSAPNVSVADFSAAVSRAFTTWADVRTASISYQSSGTTAALPGADDGLSTLGFLAQPQLANVLAATSFLIDVTTGSVLESDIFFNTSFQWSAADQPAAGRYDLETIALHEIGHFSGLGHSLLGETELSSSGRRVTSAEAVMFPIAFASGTTNRTLRADDIAAISDIYPDDDVDQRTGTLSGRVTKNGSPVFGAHVVAFNPATGALVGAFTLNSQGEFAMAGLTPGPHVVRVEPLDDASIDSFFDNTNRVDINFRGAFHQRLVVVPRGGDSGEVSIAVTPR